MLNLALRCRWLQVAACALGVNAWAAGEVTLTVTADRDLPKYSCGEPAVFRIVAARDGMLLTAGTLEYRLKLCSRAGLTLRSGQLELGGEPVAVEATLNKPGFLYLTVSGDLDGKALRSAAGAAFEPERIVPLNPTFRTLFE